MVEMAQPRSRLVPNVPSLSLRSLNSGLVLRRVSASFASGDIGRSPIAIGGSLRTGGHSGNRCPPMQKMGTRRGLHAGGLIVAEIVGAFGVPHTPVFPFFVKRDGPDSEIAQFFKALTDELVALKPDLIVMFDTDHLNTFFLDNLPVFAVGVTDTFKGPNDEPREMPVYDIKSLPDFAAHIRKTARRRRFRPCAGAGIHRRSFGRGAAALHDAADAGAGHSDLHQRPHPAAAEGAALLRARPRREARDRDLAEATARRHHGQRQFLARCVGAAHRARPHRRRARSGMVRARLQAA